jgi:hypothetical protein
LSLRHTEISDAGLQELKGIATLRHLYLEGTNVTDGGIQVLSGLRDLRTLGVDSTNVTEVGKMLLKTAMPRLTFSKLPRNPN